MKDLNQIIKMFNVKLFLDGIATVWIKLEPILG